MKCIAVVGSCQHSQDKGYSMVIACDNLLILTTKTKRTMESHGSLDCWNAPINNQMRI
jgi:hypothetical protein